ncbi:hypothetical protein [Gordonia phthalatica]|uniref:hypothetical protein n=1 Tax=Gordonia phthalatica TaxID=1136941 RepID=UPI0012FEC18C|nr:hypothetical protein [Gordonia phthalatica]
MTVIGWVLLAFGAIGAIASIPAGSGFGGVLIGLAFAFAGAAIVWRFLTWKIATPIAVVLLFIGGALSPKPAEEPVDKVTPLLATTASTSQPTTSTTTSSKRPTTSKSTTTSKPTSTTTHTATVTKTVDVTTTGRPAPAPRTTHTPRPAPVYETPTPEYTPPAYTPPANPGSNGRTGAICNDGTHDSRTGRGACSGHNGVATWLY